jgi:hypothetical protein
MDHSSLSRELEEDIMWLAEVYVTLKPAVRDPQGMATQSGLHNLGFENAKSVRVGTPTRTITRIMYFCQPSLMCLPPILATAHLCLRA